MRITLYAQCWNDEFMLPYFFRHYDPLVEKYVIFDDDSTDSTLSILRSHSKVEIRRFARSDPESFVLSEQSLSNECWKESRGKADWVIVTDVDEHLYHYNIYNYLMDCAKSGVTIVPALGFQMISESLPNSEDILCESCTRGVPWRKMMKASIFNPTEIQEICFATGRHQARPIGNIRVPYCDQLTLLHFKYLGFSHTYSRHRSLASGLGSKDVASRWGYKYLWSQEQFREDWDNVWRSATDIMSIRGNPSPSYPAARWWDKYERVPSSAAR